MQTVQYSSLSRTSPMTTTLSSSLHHFNPPQPRLSDFEIPNSPVTTDSDKCSTTEELTYTTQYYTTLQSPLGMMHADSPKGEGMSPHSNSSSSDSDSSGEEVMGECIATLNNESPSGAIVVSDGGVRHWTYEDQFKQLYNMSPEIERREFLDKLFSFMQNKGTPITRIPIMAKQPLDLYKLFKLVVERGGLVEVIKKKAWRNVAKELKLPASITSAAFTMRSQYVKYLYPYECEVAKLSNSQELQLAIESNKRDRRHSDTVEFISSQLTRPDLDQAISPAARQPPSGNTSGLQLITSPTVAIPHGAMPPYSGGFIVTGSGAHQVVPMAHHIPGIPIVVPGTSTHSGHNTQPAVVWAGRDIKDHQDDSDHDITTPPAKKMAFDMNHGHGIVTLASRLPTGLPGNFIVAPGNTVVQQHPSSPHVIQMAAPGHSQIPLVIPAPIPAKPNGQRPPMLKMSPKSSTSLNEQNETVFSSPPYGRSPAHNVRLQEPRHVERVETEEEERSPSTNLPKMPFANISVQSAGGKGENGESNSSLLVTMEINNVVFQGVLFAKPQANAGSSSPN